MADAARSEEWTGYRELHLAQLLAARLCHDLAGGLGSVANAVQLACEGDAEALALAGQATQSAVQRLRLLRAAWGGGEEALGLAELRQLSAGLARNRLRVVIDVSADALVPPDAARLVLNVMLLASDSLPRGGVLAVGGDGRRELLVSIDGPDAAWPRGFPACTVDPASAWLQLSAPDEAAQGVVQAALTALIAHQTGLGLSFLMAGSASPAPPLLLRLSRDPG